MTSAESTNRTIDALKAQLAALEGKTDDAILALEGKDDPESLLRHLTILTDADRYDEAATAIRAKPPNERWCEKGVLALAAAGRAEEAATLVEWAHAQDNIVLWQSAVLARAQGRYLHTSRESGSQLPVLPGELSTREEAGMRAALADLDPLVQVVKAVKRIQNGIEASAVSLAMEISYVLDDREEYRRLAGLLWERKPLPLQYAYAVLRKVIPPNPELPTRLRAERGDTFEASRLAALIEGTLLGKAYDALSAVRELLVKYRSAEHVEQLASLLLRLSPHLPVDMREEVIEEASKLLGDGSRYARLSAVEREITANNFGEAEQQLQSEPDEHDPNWLELLADVRLGQGREGEAVDLLVRATEVGPDPGLLRKASLTAERAGRRDTAAHMVERILRLDPDDIPARVMLASLYSQLGEYEKAAGQYRQLQQLRPDEVAFGINEAACLAFALKHDASLRVYEELCQADSPPMEAILGRASLLKMMNRADAAFKSLEQFKVKFNDHPEFLKSYVDLGYASKREDEAQWGFSRLHELQSKGAIDKVLHEVQFTELIEMMRQHNENEEILNRGILKGQFPWLLAGEILNHSAAESFQERTQPLRWLGDEPAAWAKHTVYSTNGYVVIGESGGQAWIEPIEAPDAAHGVVIDLTSLMTLYRLGILKKAADYFGVCYYPSSYNLASNDERAKLVAHQPLRPQAAAEIKSAIESGRIGEFTGDVAVPYVHEHRPENVTGDEHSYGLVDLLPGLEAGHLITDAVSREIRLHARRASGVDGQHAPLRAQDGVRIDHSTLELITQHGALNAVLSSFRVYVSSDDKKLIEAELSGWNERLAIGRRQASMWEDITNDARFVYTGVTLPIEFQVAEERHEGTDAGNFNGTRSWLTVQSVFLAEGKQLPLLVDDRCCQMLAHNSRRATSVAFGTDRFLATLLENKLLSSEQTADAYLRLMVWRYRFLVPPVGVLLELAKRSLTFPPGQHLLKVSRYVQDCMRDVGLFCGLEATVPPMSMAQKTYLAWTNTLANFVVSLWIDPDVPEDAARSLTKWALTECLPAPPSAMGSDGRILAELQHRAVLYQALVRSASLTDTERVNKALICISSVLGITKREYLRQVAEIANALGA